MNPITAWIFQNDSSVSRTNLFYFHNGIITIRPEPKSWAWLPPLGCLVHLWLTHLVSRLEKIKARSGNSRAELERRKTTGDRELNWTALNWTAKALWWRYSFMPFAFCRRVVEHKKHTEVKCDSSCSFYFIYYANDESSMLVEVLICLIQLWRCSFWTTTMALIVRTRVRFSPFAKRPNRSVKNTNLVWPANTT